MAQSLTTNREPDSSLHLCFQLDEKVYALNSDCVIEIIMIPSLSRPQKLSENVVGILNYNGILINVIDIRRMLNLPQKPYDKGCQTVILKGEESLLAIIVDKVSDFFNADPSNIEPTSFDVSKNFIKSFYNNNGSIINILNVVTIENMLKLSKTQESTIDYTLLFPQDESSKTLLEKRSKEISSKLNFHLENDFFDIDKYILFSVNSHTYCLFSAYVKELISLKNYHVTKIPYTPNFIKGIINIKGDFYTVLSLKEYIDFDEINEVSEDKIIVLESKDLKLALLVDEILDVVTVAKDQIHNKNDLRLDDMYIKAEIYSENRVYNLLNIDKLINDKKLYIG